MTIWKNKFRVSLDYESLSLQQELEIPAIAAFASVRMTAGRS